ncbi:non-ribosomal peptide synthetase [Croceitalea marina]|uniref:Non-ribosomal peptide synthetase n=1 Tax=Croceitalea marina TaxID=1775166 RepID=A0ABW5N1U7_9FLAO
MKNLKLERLEGLFKEAAYAFPDRVALSYKDQKITYEELNVYSDRVSNYLLDHVTEETKYIGIFFDRGLESIISLLGILKAGYAYIPIDTSYPEKRINDIITDSGLDLIATNKVNHLKDTIVKKVKIDFETIKRLKSPAQQNSILPKTNEAYVIYTSGTTGKPKGVVIEHYNVIRLFTNTEDLFQFSETDKWTLFHSLSFDFSVWELFGALLNGGELVIVPYKVSRNPGRFVELIHEKKVTVLNQTPTAFANFIQSERYNDDRIETLRLVVFGGERLEMEILKPWVSRYGLENVKLINMFGITESTIHITYKQISQDDFNDTSLSPIGIPISDMNIDIFNHEGKQITTSEIGEMYISGPGLAKKYLNNEVLTAEKFICKDIDGEEVRYYKSGDLGYYKDGTYYYIKRNDNQVQLNGFRIELSEITKVTELHDSVAKSNVLLDKDKHEQSILINYVLVHEPIIDTVAKDNLSKELFKLMKDRLPNYMVPFQNVILDQLPTNENGKLDIQSLKDIELVFTDNNEENSIPEKMKSIWSELLGNEEVPEDVDFFDLGGTSLSLIQLIHKTQDYFSVKIDVFSMIDRLTLGEFINEIEDKIKQSEIVKN